MPDFHNAAAAARTALKNKLKARGIPQSVADALVTSGKSRRQVVEDLIAYCRTLPPKAK